MGRVAPIFGVLGLLGFAALHACSSDDGATDGKKGGGGGDGGDAGAPPTGGTSGNTSGGGSGATGGSTTTGGTGATAATGGAAGQAGETSTGGVSGDAGSGGEGGSGAVGPGDACTMCMDGSAEVLQANCETSPSCTRWKTCMRGCSEPECLDACDAANPDVAPYRFAIYEALCDACATPCSALELCDRDCTDNASLVLQNTPPATLAETGLYSSPTATPDEVAAYARPFHPKYELWSDGAVKRRWAYIPRCSRINTEGINHWIFPVGTRLWKEFVVPAGSSGVAGTRVETRFLHKFAADDDNGWLFATYQWPMNNANPTAADAMLAPAGGVTNANGTQHDIPARPGACQQCHQSLQEKVLGFSAIQLSHEEAGVTIRSLADAGWLTFPAAAPGLGGGLARAGFNPPGTEVDQAALGYLHANCGNCHHAGTIFGGATPVRMRLMVGMNTLQTTDTFTSLVNVPTVRLQFVGCDRIEPGFAQFSEIMLRMGRRDVPLPGLQMPPLATEQVHTAALNGLRDWINAMPNTGTPPTTCTPPP